MSDWWIHRSVHELETALRDRTVVENHYLEFKPFDRLGKVPATIAGSIAGLAIDGGVLVIGAKEIRNERRFEPEPRSLVGLPEAVDQTIETRVAPVVRVSVLSIDRGDDTGLLAFIVPASSTPPHIVVKRVAFGMRRFRNYRIRALLYAGKPNWELLDALTPP